MWQKVSVIGFLRFVFALLASDPPVGGNVECCPQLVWPPTDGEEQALVRSYEKWRREAWSSLQAWP